MKLISHISIPNTCTQNWDAMQVGNNDRFCQNCQKSVTDFSVLSKDQILDVLSSTSAKVCGRFNETQLLTLNDRLMSERITLFSWQKIGLATALLAAIPFINVQAKIIHPTEQMPVQYKNAVVLVDTNVTSRLVTGHIIDADDKRCIPDVIVKIKGTNTAIATDVAGNFSIRVPVKNDVVLLVYFVGYHTQEVNIKAGDRPVYDLQLKASKMMLGEVVIRKPPLWKRPYYAVRRVVRRIFG